MSKKKQDKLLMGLLKWEEETGKSFLDYLDKTPSLKDLASMYKAIHGKQPETFEDIILFKIELNTLIMEAFVKASESLSEEERFVLESIAKAKGGKSNEKGDNIASLEELIGK